jgi:hypothetical protein
MPAAQRVAFERIVMGRIGRRLGLSHSLHAGAARLALAVTDPGYHAGIFYASHANTLTGPVVDQATIFSDLANTAFQDNAHEAIHRFLERQPRDPTGAHTS